MVFCPPALVEGRYATKGIVWRSKVIGLFLVISVMGSIDEHRLQMFAARARDLLVLEVLRLAGVPTVQVDSRFCDGRAMPAVMAISLRIGGLRAKGNPQCPCSACRAWAVHPTDRVCSCGCEVVEFSSWDW